MLGTKTKFIGQVSFIALSKNAKIESAWKSFCESALEKDPLLNPSELLIDSNWGLLTFREFEDKVEKLGNYGTQSLSYYKVYKLE